MIDLDKPGLFSQIDKNNLLKNIQEFPLQCERAWKEIKKVVLPSYYVKADKIVILGMGGSRIGGDLIKALIEQKSKIPIHVVREYDLPGFVDKNSLVIGVSYSGDTEETLESFKQAIKRKAKLVAIATGGKLAKLANSYKIPLYQFDYKAMPRQAFGFLFGGILGILNKTALIDIKDEDFEETILLLKALNSKIKPEIPVVSNLAKKLAKELYHKIVVILGGSYLEPVASRFKTQINENSEQMAFWEELPEACHNFIAGLKFPENLKEIIFIISLISKFDHPRVKARQKIISEILDKNKIPLEELRIEPAPSVLSELLSFIFVLDYASFYLAMLNNVDPEEISNIKYLKKRLEEIPWQR